MLTGCVAPYGWSLDVRRNIFYICDAAFDVLQMKLWAYQHFLLSHFAAITMYFKYYSYLTIDPNIQILCTFLQFVPLYYQLFDWNSVAFTAKKEGIEAHTSGKMVSLSLSSFSGRWAKCLFIRILYCFLSEKGKQKHVKWMILRLAFETLKYLRAIIKGILSFN